MKKIFETVVGLLIWAAIGYGGYYFFIKSDPKPYTPTQADFDSPLSTYKETEMAKRSAIIAELASQANANPEDIQNFINCMGDFAETKLETLITKDVFEWCVTESKNNRDRFTSHYNELDAQDKPSDAIRACQSFMEKQLLAPASAEHPSGGQRYSDHGKGRYTVATYVDAQNAFGAQIRTNYICTVRFTNTKKPWHPDAWELEELQSQ